MSATHNKLTNPNRLKAHQLAIYKHDRGAELGFTEKQLQLSGTQWEERDLTRELRIMWANFGFVLHRHR